jgi:hypothetical protein
VRSNRKPWKVLRSGAEDEVYVDASCLLAGFRSTVRWAVGNKAWDPASQKWKKPPLDPRTGRNLSTNKPDEWVCSYEEAVRVKEEKGYDFVGFLLTEDDPYHVTDLDGVIGREGAVDPRAQKLIEEQATYVELSLSGAGVHTIGSATKPENHKKKFKLDGLGIESYDRLRFVVFTGHALNDEGINDVQRWVVASVAIEEPVEAPEASLAPVDSSDTDLLLLLENSKNGKKFRLIYHEGSLEKAGYPSQSEADLALCGMLAWATRCDKDRMDQLFRSSSLFRAKWDQKRGSKTYGQTTIEKSVEGCTSVYDPSEVRALIARLYGLRMNMRWTDINACHLYRAYLDLGYHYGTYVPGEGILLKASVRDLNLLGCITRPTSKDHMAISVSWRVLRDMGLIREVVHGGPASASSYMIVDVFSDPSLISALLPHPSSPNNRSYDFYAYAYTPPPVFLSVGILRKEEMEEVDRLIKLAWTPSLNKKQKFLAEQVLYGRSTIEDLVAYFGARKNDLLKRTIAPLLEGGILLKEDGTLRFSWEGVDEAFVDSGGEDLLLGYVRRVRGERQRSKKLGSAHAGPY